jgi:hypothetical protein
MTFPTLDDAESALDWIGLGFIEGDGWFEGELDEGAAELLDAAVADGETPLAVRALAATLRERWIDAAAPRRWRVTFPVG